MKDVKITDKELYRMAKEASKGAYAPYSNFCVGAAAETEDGKIYTGVNIENASFGAGICAERTAMAKAVSEGARNFSRIAVCSAEGAAWPCGICRQFMNEFADDPAGLLIISGEDEDHLETVTLAEMLPKGFRL